MSRTLLCVLCVVAPIVSFGQAAEGKLAFEVASVKPAAPPTGLAVMLFQMRGGPGTADPGQISYTNVPMRALLLRAYGLKPPQLSGPNWLENTKYDIVAKIPAGATREQVNVMVQNLLVERFGLAAHHETRDLPGYEMAVSRNGPKIKESPESPTVVAAAPVPGVLRRIAMGKDKDGLPELAPGSTGLVTLPAGAGSTRYSARNQPLSQLAGLLDNPDRKS